MKRKNVILLVISLALYIILFKAIKHLQIENESIILTSKESRLLIPNTHLYEQMDLIDMSNGKINTFLFDTSPPFADEPSRTIFTEPVHLGGKEYKYWTRYFNNGSTFQMQWNLNSNTSILILKGENAIQRWVNGNIHKEPWTKTERHSLSYDGNYILNFILLF